MSEGEVLQKLVVFLAVTYIYVLNRLPLRCSRLAIVDHKRGSGNWNRVIFGSLSWYLRDCGVQLQFTSFIDFHRIASCSEL